MDRIDIDKVEVDDLDDLFIEILPPDQRGEYMRQPTDVARLKFIIGTIRDNYSPFFDSDDDISSLLDELDVLIDVDDPDFELTPDIIDTVVNITNYVRADDVHPQMKARLIILLTYALELVGD